MQQIQIARATPKLQEKSSKIFPRRVMGRRTDYIDTTALPRHNKKISVAYLASKTRQRPIKIVRLKRSRRKMQKKITDSRSEEKRANAYDASKGSQLRRELFFKIFNNNIKILPLDLNERECVKPYASRLKMKIEIFQ